MVKEIKKIAIIGMGVAGVSALREWTRQKEENPQLKITAFGDAETFGRGQPYQKEDEVIIMNQPASLATIIPEKKMDFVDWLKENQGEEKPASIYYPRALFGDYLTDRMNTWLLQSNAQTVKEKVNRIQPLANGQFRVQSTSHEEDFDFVHLCIGSSANQDPYQLVGHSHFILEPFPVEKQLSVIPKGARVGVIGTGLTSVDILRYFDKHRPDLKLSFFSHSGRFKTARGETIPYEYQYFTKENVQAEKAKNGGFISLDTYRRWLKKEIEYQGVFLDDNWLDQAFGSKERLKEDLNHPHEIGVVQTLILGLDRLLTELWLALIEEDKTRFFDEYKVKWDKIRSSFPKESGEKLLKLWENDKIKTFSQLREIIKKEESFEMILKDKESQQVDYLINATASEKQLTFKMERMPLISQLLNERILQAETFGGVQVTTPDLSAISQKYGLLKRFKVHGPLISGIQFGNNSIDIISEGVQTAVLDSMSENLSEKRGK